MRTRGNPTLDPRNECGGGTEERKERRWAKVDDNVGGLEKLTPPELITGPLGSSLLRAFYYCYI
jgi:hypothetical protein